MLKKQLLMDVNLERNVSKYYNWIISHVSYITQHYLTHLFGLTLTEETAVVHVRIWSKGIIQLNLMLSHPHSLIPWHYSNIEMRVSTKNLFFNQIMIQNLWLTAEIANAAQTISPTCCCYNLNSLTVCMCVVFIRYTSIF